MPSTLTGYPRDVSVSQAVLLQLQRTWPVMSQADISAFCAIARDTCLPDCEPTHRQCHECALLITWVLRERTDGRPWRSCKGLLRTILTEDRKVAAP